jgi:hypothetical protein
MYTDKTIGRLNEINFFLQFDSNLFYEGLTEYINMCRVNEYQDFIKDWKEESIFNEEELNCLEKFANVFQEGWNKYQIKEFDVLSEDGYARVKEALNDFLNLPSIQESIKEMPKYNIEIDDGISSRKLYTRIVYDIIYHYPSEARQKNNTINAWIETLFYEEYFLDSFYKSAVLSKEEYDILKRTTKVIKEVFEDVADKDAILPKEKISKIQEVSKDFLELPRIQPLIAEAEKKYQDFEKTIK